MLRTVLAPLADGQVLAGGVVDPLAHVALGGLYGAALYIARAHDPAAARAARSTPCSTRSCRRSAAEACPTPSDAPAPEATSKAARVHCSSAPRQSSSM